MIVDGIYGIDLHVKFGQEEKPEDSGHFFDYAEVKDLEIKTEGVEITSVNEHDAEHSHNEKVKILRIRHQTVQHLPKGLEKFFPNVESLVIVGTELETLSQSDLKPFTHLTELFVHSNLLETLDDHIFEFNTGLVDVNFGDNKLKHIGEHVLTPLTKLKRADFSGNVCVDNFGGEGYTKTDFTELLNDIKTKCKA